MTIERNRALSALLLAFVFGLPVGCKREDPPAQSHDEPGPRDDHPHGDEHPHGEDHPHGEEEGGEAPPVVLSEEEIAEYGVQVAVAGAGELRIAVAVPGEVEFNPDRVAHVTPRVEGVVREVYKQVGDPVKAGEVLALLDSREFAEAQAEYLAAIGREQLAVANFEREEKLWREKLAVEREYLEAKQALSEARVQRELAERQLHALGMSDDELAALPDEPHSELTRYPLTTPIGGVVTQRHLVRGEITGTNTVEPPFVIADLSTVWVDLTIYAREFGAVAVGQGVLLGDGDGEFAEGTISFISPSLHAQTRTARARVVLQNPDGHWKPGMFVDARVVIETPRVRVAVPHEAILTLNDRDVLFVRNERGFVPRNVRTGRRGLENVEIVEGVEPGESYVARNGFILKAELGKGEADHPH